MKGLYDIHCHILPGVDDGARNMEESLWMLNKEYQEGVRHVILTPHFRYDMFEPHMNIVTRQFMQLRRAACTTFDCFLPLRCTLPNRIIFFLPEAFRL